MNINLGSIHIPGRRRLRFYTNTGAGFLPGHFGGNTGITCLVLLGILFISSTHGQNLTPESVFREYSFNRMVTPFKGEFAAYDSFQVKLDIDDLMNATGAEVALNFWGGHIGTSDQTFKINGSGKFDFPQPTTPGNPYCYFRFIQGNPPVKIPHTLLKRGENIFTFFCGKQICHGFNWPLYWLNSFTVRVYYDKDSKKYARGRIRVRKPEDREVAYNLVGFETDVDNASDVESVEYIGSYDDYDLEGDGKRGGWKYIIRNGEWHNIIGKQSVSPYGQNWNNNWVPEQDGVISVMAKVNSRNGLSYLTTPVDFSKLRQPNSCVKLYETESLEENFASRIGRRKECKIKIADDLGNAISAYLILSSWSGESEDGAKHMIGMNDKMLAESPGKLHDWAFVKVPVPIELLRRGDNIFFVYSETEEHMFEINYPGPAILIRYAVKGDKTK